MRKSIARILLGLLGLLILYFIAAMIGAIIPNGNHESVETNPHESTEILLLAGPIHYDFLIPLTDDVRKDFAEFTSAGVPIFDPAAEWLLIGWGARNFYTTAGSYADVSASAVVRAIFGDSSVLRTEVLGPIRPDLDLPRFKVNEAQFKQMRQAILDSFAREADGIIPVSGNLSSRDQFFAASERFHLFRTCNTWVGDMIQAAGLPFGRWVPLPYSVSLSHSNFLAHEPTD
ncbi:hypothetical protein ROA7450_00235 [Roseovarius albus]|uniref:DUF2459 domain-containing protein n=1 Tax=Roseovarius albus TaxID=1247867 RepID=A0A1X6Y9G4_9RHOB|nr:TIGR02117 family protein [Roseovarius albus]SLN13940.1 hypothetical protein ROA7450_00235 [Roseovarius albus]